MCITFFEVITRLVFLSVHVSCCRGHFLIKVSGIQVSWWRADPWGGDYMVVNLAGNEIGYRKYREVRQTCGTTCAYSWLQTTLSAVLSTATSPDIVRVTAEALGSRFGRGAPVTKALDILDIAWPTEAAYSGGSSETLGQWILGTTSVCPGRSGSMSTRGARLRMTYSLS